MNNVAFTDDVEVVSFYLHPGNVFASTEPALISTVLGSCVAVCLWDSVTKVGGMNHFLLPRGRGARYGSDAMSQLLDEILQRGASTSRLAAKVFGGASVLAGFTGPRRAIGEQNVELAMQFLEGLAIPVRGEQTGGTRGRKLLFHTGMGQAYVKEL
jgi:chemotaxis protein CheD